ncbi:TIGR01244 family sulfur transferase [Aurantiacibacter rhizosphaerae]|uniref:TIGR01244 family sulfur transferase n=1 Tax=Aurantiacibacter rhizosphaerae TaxID=2691582 RepID=UPI00301DF51D
MDTTQLTDGLSVSPQISPAEVSELAAAGYKSIICNRPDEEETGQPDFADIAAAATALGLSTRHIPVDAERPVEMQADAFAKALAELPGPVLAYCRTGNRCTKLHEAISD